MYHITKCFPEGVTVAVAVAVALDTKRHGMARQGCRIQPKSHGRRSIRGGGSLDTIHPCHAMGTGCLLCWWGIGYVRGVRGREKKKKGRGWLYSN